jgi:ribosomal protein L12E/L44/L45/RPP1/RPP2
MQYVTAYTLISQNSKTELSTTEMKSKIVELLSAINAELCEESLALFLSNIEGKTYSELIATGSELMKSQISASSSNTQTSSKKESAAVVEEEKEVKEESEPDMDFF